MSQQPPSDDSSTGRSGSASGAFRRSAYQTSPYDHELSTDPGRLHAYESLYRGSQDGGRPTPRHWEPNLSPPETETGGDTYGWLYRPATVEFPAQADARPAAAPPRPATAPLVTPPSARSVPASRGADHRSTAVTHPHAPTPARPAPRRLGRALLTVLLVVLVLSVAAAAGMIWQS